jgi:hypothetical protein
MSVWDPLQVAGLNYMGGSHYNIHADHSSLNSLSQLDFHST